ncbi:hypothetical protein HWV62_22662 [Athelia sp. TMB]|nr:hypothetical protein HWV62_22662 [Athelia sp. TMB]
MPLCVLAVLPAVLTAAVRPHGPRDVTTSNIGQLPILSWAENMAVRSNGQLLVTLVDVPELWQIDPFGSHESQLLLKLPVAGGLLGIAEIQPDIFAVVAGSSLLPGFFSIWKIDLQAASPTYTKVTNIPPAIMLNGATTLNENAILVADSSAGVVYRVDTLSGNYSVVLDDPTMKAAAGSILHLGINGLHVRDNYLYYTSSTQGIFVRIPINDDGTAAGAAEIIAHNGLDDDFTFDSAGNAYVATNSDNTVQKITPAGEVTVIAGSANSPTFAGATSAHFGRTAADESVLYITTDGIFTRADGFTTFGTGGVVAIYGL